MNTPMLTRAQLEKQRSEFRLYWIDCPWHAGGDRIVEKLAMSLRSFRKLFQEMPGNFLPSVMDQYLAVIWHTNEVSTCGAESPFAHMQWSFHAFEILSSLGDDRYLARDDTGKEFNLYSPNIYKDTEQRMRVFISVIVDTSDNWCMTYGPLMGWSGFSLRDLVYFASCAAPQTFDQGGVDAVMRFNPVPFWALWHNASLPALYHGNEELIDCWVWGSFFGGIDFAFPKSWTKQDSGKYTRWLYGSNLLERREVFLDRTTARVLVYTHCEGDFRKTLKLLGSAFIPSPRKEDQSKKASLFIVTAIAEILKKKNILWAWEKKFSKFD